jgi:hypothetical protein
MLSYYSSCCLILTASISFLLLQDNHPQYILFSVVGIYRYMTEQPNGLTHAGIVSIEAWLVWEGEQTQFHSSVYRLTVTKDLCFQ